MVKGEVLPRGELRVGPAAFVRALLAEGRRPPLARPITRARAPAGPPARMQWIAAAIRRDAAGWLVRQGGWRVRQVVVGGRRREGRLWSPEVAPRLELRFTAAPLALWAAVMESAEALPALPAPLLERLRSAAGPGGATGDLVALHRLIAALLRSTPLASGDELERRETLHALSPLTLATHPEVLGRLDGAAPDPLAARAARLAPLFAGDRPVLLSYLDQAIARSWLAEEAERRALEAALALDAYRAAADGLAAFARAAARRPDALRPLLRFFEGYLTRFGARDPVVQAIRRQATGFNRTSERDALCGAAAGLFAAARAVEDAVERALSAPFVDRSEEEKVLLADHHDAFRALAPELEAIRRELAGEVG